MEKLKNILAGIYFIVPMLFILMYLFISPIMFWLDINTIFNSGFAGPKGEINIIFLFGFFISISCIPPLKRIYKVFPWLYSYVKISFSNLIIFNIGVLILNTGYEVQDDVRKSMFFILMIVQILICRLVVCIYFKLKPAKCFGERKGYE